MFSGESNIRQIVVGREIIHKALGFEMVTFLEEEEFSHPQIPQMVMGAGFKYASLAQVDTWGNAGIPKLELNAFHWKGQDGTTVLCIPKNSLFGYSPDLKKLAASEAFKKLRALGKPLIFTWEEFGWEPPEEPAYLKTPEKYLKFAKESPVEFVTLKDYLDKYGSHAKETIYLSMDRWTKLLTWGLGGDQLRIMDRKVEGLLHAAERFDAIASSLGARTKVHALEQAWKDLLASQSHDVSLCEYSRWQGDRMAPLDRIEDKHNFTWGAIGYNHLDAAESGAQTVLDASLRHIRGQVGSGTAKHGQLAVTVFNHNAWERSEITQTGRIYPIPGKAKGVVVKDRTGRALPSQIIKSDADAQGNLIVANVAFLAEKVPSVGYDTYYLDFTPQPVSTPATDLRIDEDRLELENKYLKVRLSPDHGAIVSLIEKSSGREMLDGQKGPFPIFKGRPNKGYCALSAFVRGKYKRAELEIPDMFDSSQSRLHYQRGASEVGSEQVDWQVKQKSLMRWTETGPIRATLKARHNWPLLKFETHVTLSAGMPYVEVISRVLAEIPPTPDELGDDHRFPIEIKEGYWLTFTPGFLPTAVYRDFPLGVEPTERTTVEGLTFVDLVGQEGSLLILHPGTQYFKRESNGTISNLVMREWESYFTGEFGWPRYSEFRHALMPHGPGFKNADRLRAATEFGQKLLTVVGPPQGGSLPARKSFLRVSPEGVQLSAFRRKSTKAYELRVVEVEGQEASASVELDIPVTTAAETDLLGRKVGQVTTSGGKFGVKAQPWKLRNFELA
jgi:alpha-mannosidase